MMININVADGAIVYVFCARSKPRSNKLNTQHVSRGCDSKTTACTFIFLSPTNDHSEALAGQP